jgi:parallel beta helix pectate lyase-like protein
MLIARFARVLLISSCLLLALPAFASAAQIVNTVEDAPDAISGGTCETAAGKCSLRAAIDVTNFAGVADNIIFDLNVFKGQVSNSTITLSSQLPIILAPVTINAGTCLTQAGINGPCAGVSGPISETAMRVAATGASVFDLAFVSAGKGIEVSNDDFTAAGNWFGLKLDGTPGTTSSFGIAVEPGAEDTQIGGTTEVSRNVFANSTTGLRLRGSQDGVVEGNYFGVGPDGTTVRPNVRDLVVADSAVGVGATGNTIGAEVGVGGAGTPACDLGCNAFVSPDGSEATIDLQGEAAFEEKPATGPTTIVGNYIGMKADGEVASTAADEGVQVGSAGEVTIGSKNVGGGNLINGGNYAVFSGSPGGPAKKLEVLGNTIGRSRDNSGPSFPPDQGLGIFSAGIASAADAAVIEANQISAEGTGIENHSTGATIAGNTVYEGGKGIWVRGDTEGTGIGNLIKANTIFGSEQTGIYIQNDLNIVIGNYVSGSGSGIGIENFLSLASSENVIGRDGDKEANTIIDSEFSAIDIVNLEGSQNEIGTNTGSGNGGKFIRLKANDPGAEPVGPNGGIKPPVVAAASKTEASGTADAGDTVRVFNKVSTAPGELGAYLGKVTADVDGKWKLTYLSPVSGGTFVAATQTNADGGTSEVSASASVPPDPPTGCPAVSSQCPIVTPPSPAPDTTKPKVTIKSGPKAKSTVTTAKFKFVSDEAGSKFKCKLDKKAFANCKSPKTYKKLKPGKHTFKVKATDAAGNVSAVPMRKFTVLE